MEKVAVYNFSKDTCLGQEVRVAATWWRRLRGLLGLRRFNPGQGLLLTPCKAVHSIGMRFGCDALYLDSYNRVVAIKELKPNRLGPFFPHAYQVLELPLGTAADSLTTIGDLILVRTQLS